MYLNIYEVSELIFTALEGLIIIITFALISNRRNYIFKPYAKVGTFIFVYTIYSYWLTLFIPTGFHSLIICILTAFVLNFLFNATLLKSFLKTFSILIAMSLVEIIISVFGMFIMDIPISSLLKNELYVFICSYVVKSLEFVLIYIFYKADVHINWLNDSNPHPSRFGQICMIITSVLFLIEGTSIYMGGNSENLFIFNIFSFIIYVVLIIAVVMAFREGSRLEIIEFASELKKENLQQLITFNEMVAKERHEYKNHLNTIYGLCTLNKPDLSDKIKQYINNYANNCDTRHFVIDSGNDFVDAIINVKYNNALRKGIEVIVDFDIPLSVAKIDENVAVTIISNIIENAFESIVMFEKENKYISIQTYIENNNYYISISNNGPVISESDKKKIFSAGFSTKDNSAKKRGFGLSIVLAEIEHCGGNISINSTEKVTEFLICLKINEQRAVV